MRAYYYWNKTIKPDSFTNFHWHLVAQSDFHEGVNGMLYVDRKAPEVVSKKDTRISSPISRPVTFLWNLAPFRWRRVPGGVQ